MLAETARRYGWQAATKFSPAGVCADFFDGINVICRIIGFLVPSIRLIPSEDSVSSAPGLQGRDTRAGMEYRDAMKLLVTAGPTREPIDPVRYVSNRSSGKMGYAVAARAAERGHEVRLVSGPVALAAPDRVEVFGINTAVEMLDAVRRHIGWCDALVMAAAVADWRPAAPGDRKLKKADMRTALMLEPTPDILMEIRPLKKRQLIVGFAAETGDPLDEALRKLAAKGLDLIVANDVSAPGAGFEVDTNRVTLVARDGSVVALPLMTKLAVADKLLDWIEDAARSAGQSRGA